MNQVTEMLWHRLTGLMPGELKQSELGWLFSPHRHLSLLARRRASRLRWRCGENSQPSSLCFSSPGIKPVNRCQSISVT